MSSRRSMFVASAALLGALALGGCSSEGRVLDIEVVTGHETGAMTESPAVEKVIVQGIPCSGCGEAIEAEATPGGTLDFGEVDGSVPYTFEVTGKDGAGNTVMRGRSFGGIVLDGIDGDAFSVFAQRLGSWARPPGKLARGHVRAPGVSVGERFLFLTGGDPSEDAAQIELYDLFAWASVKGDEPFAFAAQTLWSDATTDGAQVLALSDEAAGQAQWFDGTDFTGAELPDGLASFAEIAGGSVVFGPSRVFLIGATRAGTPTDAVVDVNDTDGTITVRRLVQKRAGAAAMWLEDVGLVLAGGSAEGPGIEVLGEDATSFAIRDFAPDPTTFAAAVRGSVSTVMTLVGGTLDGAPQKTRTLDPRCTIACVVQENDAITPDASLTRTAAYFWTTGRLIVTGDDSASSGLTRTFIIDDLKNTVTEVPLREPRRFATSFAAPNGTLALAGGVHPDGTPALTVEMFFPE